MARAKGDYYLLFWYLLLFSPFHLMGTQVHIGTHEQYLKLPPPLGRDGGGLTPFFLPEKEYPVILTGIHSFRRYSICIVKKKRAGEGCLDYARKGIRNWWNGRKAVRSPDRSGIRRHPFHDHRQHTPYFVVKILLTHKILLHIIL